MANPNSSRPPSPLPSWGQDQALSGPLVGGVGASVWSQSDSEEKEGPFAIMEEDEAPDTDVKPSPWGRCGLYPAVHVISVKAASPREAGDLCHRRVAVQVQRGDMPLVELPEWEEVP